MQKYELMILYKPLLLDDIKKNTYSKIEEFVKDNNGEIKEVDNLGKRLLAYPVKKFKEGHYIQYDLSLNPNKTAELKRNLTLQDNILRFIMIRK
jgi:small subunit ribosomal protein S6